MVSWSRWFSRYRVFYFRGGVTTCWIVTNREYLVYRTIVFGIVFGKYIFFLSIYFRNYFCITYIRRSHLEIQKEPSIMFCRFEENENIFLWKNSITKIIHHHGYFLQIYVILRDLLRIMANGCLHIFSGRLEFKNHVFSKIYMIIRI